MQFSVQRNDIANMAVDAIVLPANSRLMIGSGASRAIFDRAGKDELEKECKLRLTEAKRKKAKLVPGATVATHAFALPASVILHTIVPRWKDGKHDEYQQLCLAYLSALSTADRMGLTSLAIPVLASGNNGFDADLAIEVATKSIEAFKPDNKLSQVILVTFGEDITRKVRELGYDVEEAIDQSYVLDQEINQLKAHQAKPVKKPTIPVIDVGPVIDLANEWLNSPEVKKLLMATATLIMKNLLNEVTSKKEKKIDRK